MALASQRWHARSVLLDGVHELNRARATECISQRTPSLSWSYRVVRKLCWWGAFQAFSCYAGLGVFFNGDSELAAMPWETPLSLWSDAVNKAPDAFRAQSSLGYALIEKVIGLRPNACSMRRSH